MKNQENSKNCFVCGLSNPVGLRMKFFAVDENTIESRYIVKEQYQGWPGITHGGIVAAMLDEVMARLFDFDEKQNRFLVTAKLEVKYRKPVPIDEEIIVVGKKLENNGKVARATAKIMNTKNELLAEGSSIFIQANNLLDKLTERSKLDL